MSFFTKALEMTDIDGIANPQHKGMKNRCYDLAFKLRVVDYAKQNSNHKAAKQFGVDRKRVIEWRGQEDILLKNESKKRKRLPGAGQKVKSIEIERKLLQWMDNRRHAGGRVTGKALKKECLRLHQLEGDQSFKASCGWLRRFRRRHKLVFRRSTHIAQKLPEDLAEKTQDFLKRVIKARKLHQFELSEIANMDETPLWVDMPGNYTMETVGTKSVMLKSTGHEKSRFTVMLAALADGTKLPPLVLFKGVRRPQQIPTNIHVLMTPKAYANEEVVLHWLRNIWRQNRPVARKRLMIWDAFSGHITPTIRQAIRDKHNTHLVVIPGGCTSKLQPCDVSWNKPFKDAFRDLYDDWLMDGKIELTKAGNRKPPPRETLLKWVKVAWWEKVTTETVIKSFKVTGISSSIDGTEDDQLFSAMFSDDDDDDPFEGFSVDDVAASDAANARILDSVNEYSDGELEEEELDEDDYNDPGSPGQ